MAAQRLGGKVGAVFGFANTRSLAWAIAEAWHDNGATLTIGISSDRFRTALEKATAGWERKPHIVACDVNVDESINAAWRDIASAHGGRLHMLGHSIAYATSPAMKESFLNTTRDDFNVAHGISAYSLIALARGAVPLMEQTMQATVAATGQHQQSDAAALGSTATAAAAGRSKVALAAPTCSIMALSYIGSQRAADGYKVMGPAKASLEACSRQLAAELGPRNIRCNIISPGPVDTLAARGIPGFTDMKQSVITRSPLPRGVSQRDVGNMAAFLASDDAASITGQTLYVDGGFSAVL